VGVEAVFAAEGLDADGEEGGGVEPNPGVVDVGVLGASVKEPSEVSFRG